MGQKKAKVNLKKHGVSFEEAKEALTCETVVVLKEDSDSGEERYVYLGMCRKLNVLVVVVAYPDEDITRIISARKANKMERKYYETQL
ncbi:MAG: BrnT family toxin [Bdellovibrionaceae bacterium]|nr:BrnT family toxin [Pseudobdellovibrionaceae bacterium]